MNIEEAMKKSKKGIFPEKIFYHLTYADNYNSIMKNGFSLKKVGEQSVFGRGIYFFKNKRLAETYYNVDERYWMTRHKNFKIIIVTLNIKNCYVFKMKDRLADIIPMIEKKYDCGYDRDNIYGIGRQYCVYNLDCINIIDELSGKLIVPK